MRRVFLSYGHDEYAALAKKLKHGLDTAGLPTWFDAERLKPGGDWERYIEEGLEWASEIPGQGRFVLLMTPHSVRRPNGYCLNELARAMERELPVIPVMVSSCSPPLSIARLQWLDMRDLQDVGDTVYEQHLQRLKKALLEDNLDFEAVQTRLLQRLEPLSFQAEIDAHLAGFTGRSWVNEDIDAWLENENADRVFWITAPPGAGKTALSVWLATRRPEIAGVHFCHHGRSRKSDARRAVTSLAYQLSTHLPDYRDRLNGLKLDAILAEADAGTLFDELLSQPLTGLAPPDGRPLILLVDGLDEATEDGVNELTEVLAAEVQRTPSWLRLLLTSRPAETAVALPLQAYEPYRLEEGGEYVGDLETYLNRTLGQYAQDNALTVLIEKILNRSEGSFLYAKWVSLELAKGRLNLDDPDAFPKGLGGIYLQFFERQFPDTSDYAKRQRPVLEAMVAALEPLPIDELAEMLAWSDYERDEVPETFGSLVEIRNGRIYAFHLSALEWVGDRKRAGKFAVLASEGNRRLAEYCWGLAERHPGTMPVYALAHSVSHLLESGKDTDAGSLLLNFEYIRQRATTDVQSLLADFTDAGDKVDDAASGPDLAQALDAVRSTLLLAVPALLRDPQQLASQLQARLLVNDQPAVRELVSQALRLTKGPLLQAATPALRQAGHPLTRVLRGAAIGDDDPDLFALSAVALDDSRNVAMALGEDGMFHLWKLETGMLERRERLGDGSGCSVLASGGTRWVLGRWDGGVMIVDPTDPDTAPVERTGAGSVSDVAVAPDEGRVASGHSYESGSSGALRLWRVPDLEPLKTVDVPNGEVTAVAFSPDGETLAWIVVHSDDGISQESELRFSPATNPDAVDDTIKLTDRAGSLCYSADGGTIAVGRADGSIDLINTVDHTSRRTLAGHPVFTYKTAVEGLAFLPDGWRLVSAGWDGAICMWDLRNAEEIGRCPTDSKIYGLDVGSGGRWATTGHKSGGARIWDLDKMTGLARLEKHESGAQLAAFADLGVAVSGGPDTNSASIRIWQIDSGAMLTSMQAEGNVLAVATSPANRQIQLVDEGGVSVWRVSVDLEHGKAAIEPVSARVALDPSPDWVWTLAGAPGVVVGWESGYPSDRLLCWRPPWDKAETLMERRAYSPRLGVSSDGSTCALLDDDGFLFAFDLTSGNATTASTGIDGEFRTMAVSPSGTRVAVGNERGEVRLVALPAGDSTELRNSNGDWVNTIAFSDDETRLVVGTVGGRLELWSLQDGSLEVLFSANDAWGSAWASAGGEGIVASDALGGVHFLRRT